MKKYFTTAALIICPLLIFGQNGYKIPGSFNTISERMVSYPSSSVKIEGYLGEKINLVIRQRIKNQDVDHLVEPFRHKNETRLWQSEFWGKWYNLP